MTQATANQAFQLAARPKGSIRHSDFDLVELPMPEPDKGEVLLQVKYFAVEPAMKGWIEGRVDYVAPVEIGEIMRGRGVAQVIASNHSDYPVDTWVLGGFGWQRYLVSDGNSIPLQPVPNHVKPTAALNVLGVTGLTAYFGMLHIGKPKTGDTVLVSGAAGATGSVAGQLAHIAGARVIGIAGGQAKCNWLTQELGFAAAIDYKSEDTSARLNEVCPEGVDVFYDNVGGEILDIALNNLAHKARVVLCGGISRYDATGPLPGPVNYFNLIYRSARMEGFLLMDFTEHFPQANEALTALMRDGKLRHRETLLSGFEQLPQALMNLFTGGNIGKQLVAADP